MKKNIWAIPVSTLFVALSVTGCHAKTMNAEKSSGLSNSNESSSSVTLEQQLKSTLDYNSANSSVGILYFYSGDFDNNGLTEAFAFVENSKSEENPSHTVAADVWYVDKNGAQKILEGKCYVLNPHIALSDKKKILIAEEFYGGSGSTSHAFTVTDGNPVQLENAGEGLKQAANGNDKDFYTALSASDNGTDSYTKSDGTKSELSTGHTYKRYYLYFDGISFKEYGGIKISQSQLESAKGGKEALNSIKQAGYQIGDIFYRANGIININCSKTTGSGDDANKDNENVTLQYNNGTVRYVYGPEISDTNDYVKNSSYGGVYAAAVYPSIAAYPSSFPK